MDKELNGLIDSHFHSLAMARKGIDIKDLLTTLFEEGFAGGIDVGVDCDDLPQRMQFLSPFPSIKVSAGIGPWGVDKDALDIDIQLERLLLCMTEHPVDCIGEIGLDNYWKYGTPNLQEELFVRQIELADEMHLPIIIHNREADEQTIRILKDHAPQHGGILHCFSGTSELAQTALDKGLYISFAGPITYKKNSGLRSILKAIPIEKLLLETDSPYLSPEPYRGTLNTPLRMVEIYEEAANVKEMDTALLAQQIRTNFEALFAPSHIA